jgi:hypothetical protein
LISQVDPGPVRSLLTACDVEGYSRLASDEQRDLQNRLAEVQERAARNAGLVRGRALIQPAGDGELTRWPPETDVLKLTIDYLRELHTELVRVNRTLANDNQIRLRVALVDGMSEIASYGLAGEAPVVAARLVNADQTRKALIFASYCPLVVILDDRLYQDVVRQRFRGLRPDDYVRVLVRNDAKDFERDAWIAAPGCDSSVLAELAEPADRRAGTPKPARPEAQSTDGTARLQPGLATTAPTSGGTTIAYHAPVKHRGDVVTGTKNVYGPSRREENR